MTANGETPSCVRSSCSRPSPIADRRHRGRADDLAAGAARRARAMGLPVLLAARRNLHTAGPDERRLLRRGASLAGMAAAGRGRQSRQVQIMYGLGGERRSTEWESPGCRATRASSRSASATPRSSQLQLDIYRRGDGRAVPGAPRRACRRAGRLGLQRALLEHLETIWRNPTRGSGKCAASRSISRIPR